MQTPDTPNQTPLLDSLKLPSDIRRLSPEQLEQLCREVRSDLISTVSQIGGHFASSLGATEITIALHHVLETPKDRIVWDVGHQAYVHKILTGRRKELATVRQLGGLSGFPRREESEFDTFGVAHAGTSISAACGMLEASHHEYDKREDRNVVAVIGDGAMTCGMAFEALNHSGQLHRKLIVILNDNEMSIAPNVGALSWAFSKALTNRVSTSARKHFKELVEKGLIPRSFYRAIDKAEEAAQGFLSTPAMLFTSFGYRYMGPIDGHSVPQLVDALERAKQQDGPVLIHAMTVKGKGYAPAEKDPVKYHGVGPFEITNGKFKPKKAAYPAYTSVFGDAMVEFCKEDPRVVGITAAMPDGTGLTTLSKEMPDRYFDTGISEQHAVTFAAGLACEGMRPVCAIYSTFLQRGYDQVVHDVCIQSLPVIFSMDRGGMVGADGPTHHGVFDIGYMRILPNMVAMAPKDEAELRDMLYTAIQYLDGPTAIRYPRGSGLGVDISKKPQTLEIGKGELLLEGEDILLIGYGNTVSFCLEAAHTLQERGIFASVINPRFVKPLDEELLNREISKHSHVITVEDHVVVGGFGSAILEFMSENGLMQNRSLTRLGIPDAFIEHGTQSELYKICGFDVDAICEKALSLVGTSEKRAKALKAAVNH